MRSKSNSRRAMLFAVVFTGFAMLGLLYLLNQPPVDSKGRVSGLLSFSHWRDWWKSRHGKAPSNYDYSSSMEFPLGHKLRPTPSAAVTFELVKADAILQQCDFRIVIDGDATEYSGTVAVSNTFKFCPRLDPIGVYLQEVRSTSAIVVIPGLVRR